MPFIDAVSFAESNNPDTSYEGRRASEVGGAAAGEYIASPRTNIALGSWPLSSWSNTRFRLFSFRAAMGLSLHAKPG